MIYRIEPKEYPDKKVWYEVRVYDAVPGIADTVGRTLIRFSTYDFAAQYCRHIRVEVTKDAVV